MTSQIEQKKGQGVMEELKHGEKRDRLTKRSKSVRERKRQRERERVKTISSGLAFLAE